MPATSSASITTGGVVNITQLFDGAALVVRKTGSASDTGRTVVINQDGPNDPQDTVLASSSCANCTVLNLKGFPTGKGILKIEHTGSGTGFANSSGISIDLQAAQDAQGIFLKGAVNGTGKLINLVDSGSATLGFFDSTGLFSSKYSSSTIYSSFITASTTNLRVGVADGCLNISGGLVGSTGTSCATSSGVKLPTIVVAASGGDTTSIQTALNTCGTLGGGNIYLTDTTYAQAGVGLTFKGSNCHLIGRGQGTTTITFTGATTLFKTNSAASLYGNNSIENLTITADGNTGGVAVDISDMGHSLYQNLRIDNVGKCFRANDTQNITFYNVINNNNCTTITSIGFDASSTNPWNGNRITNNFFGSNASGIIGIQMNNGNDNLFEQNYVEPGTITSTVGIFIFDSTLATNDGVFNNQFKANYLEANDKGLRIQAPVGATGIKRNKFEDNFVEANNLDYSFTGNNSTTTALTLNTWDNNMNSNFTNPLTTFQGPFGVATSSELETISTTPWAFLGVNPIAGVAQNQFAVGSSTATNLLLKNDGGFYIKNYFTLATTTQWLNSTFNVVGTSTLSGQFASLRASTTAASTQTINWSNGNYQDIMLTAATSIVVNSTSSNPLDGGKYTLRICQDPTGSRTVTWANPITLRWWNGTTTVTSTANKCTVIGMIYSSTNGNSVYSIVASSTNLDIK
jgi:hypothetical protein